MHQVAGRVGYLVTDIFAWHIPKINEQREALLPISRHCGLGLQTVNVIRGLRKDRVRGWFFVPRQYLDQVGITRSEFFHPEYEDKAMQVVAMLATKAERHLHYGLAYIAAFPQYLHRIRLACIWPLFFAIKTLAISRNNVQVVRSEVKITRQDVKTLVRQSTLLGWSNRWLSHQYDKLNGTKAI
jgi:farnesyl-diphosphate farnesyltransferase